MKKLICILHRLSGQNLSEESTKQYLILPFFTYIGYDVNSPDEVIYEYVCDMHENGNRKVDFAFIDESGAPLIIVEAKPLGTNLEKHTGQIKSYFVSSGAEYAILTDGNQYLVYKKEQVDGDFYAALPAAEFNLTDMKDGDVDTMRDLARINLVSITHTDSQILVPKKSLNQSDQTVMDFAKTVCAEDIIGHTTAEVYCNYVDYCKKRSKTPQSHIMLSKQINKLFNTRVIQKKIEKKNQRIFSY